MKSVFLRIISPACSLPYDWSRAANSQMSGGLENGCQEVATFSGLDKGCQVVWIMSCFGGKQRVIWRSDAYPGIDTGLESSKI